MTYPHQLQNDNLTMQLQYYKENCPPGLDQQVVLQFIETALQQKGTVQLGRPRKQQVPTPGTNSDTQGAPHSAGSPGPPPLMERLAKSRTSVPQTRNSSAAATCNGSGSAAAAMPMNSGHVGTDIQSESAAAVAAGAIGTSKVQTAAPGGSRKHGASNRVQAAATGSVPSGARSAAAGAARQARTVDKTRELLSNIQAAKQISAQADFVVHQSAGQQQLQQQQPKQQHYWVPGVAAAHSVQPGFTTMSALVNYSLQIIKRAAVAGQAYSVWCLLVSVKTTMFTKCTRCMLTVHSHSDE